MQDCEMYLEFKDEVFSPRGIYELINKKIDQNILLDIFKNCTMCDNCKNLCPNDLDMSKTILSFMKNKDEVKFKKKSVIKNLEFKNIKILCDKEDKIIADILKDYNLEFFISLDLKKKFKNGSDIQIENNFLILDDFLYFKFINLNYKVLHILDFIKPTKLSNNNFIFLAFNLNELKLYKEFARNLGISFEYININKSFLYKDTLKKFNKFVVSNKNPKVIKFLLNISKNIEIFDTIEFIYLSKIY